MIRPNNHFKMQNTTLILLLLCSSLALHAQNKLEIDARLYSGYDQNIYRVPSSYINAEGDTLEAIRQNGLFSLVALSLEQKIKWDQHRLTFSGSGSARIYPGQSENNLWRGQLAQEYLFKWNRHWRFYQALNLGVYSRNGQDQSQDVLSLPLAYHQYSLMVGSQWNPSRRFYIKLEGRLGNKIYTPGETSSLRYNEKSIRTYARRKMDKGQSIAYLEGSLKYRNRNYFRESYTLPPDWEGDFEDDLDFEWDDDLIEFSESEFSMQYWNVEFAAKIEAGDSFYWKPSLEWVRRSGSNANFAYQQIKPEVLLNYQTEKSSFSLRTSYALRNFKFLKPAGSEALLHYQYWSARFKWTHALDDRWSFNTSISLTRRNSNFDQASSRLNRPYTASSAMMGLRLKL